jgi:hypothetical protein
MKWGDPYYEQLRNKFFDEHCPAYGEDPEIENCLHCPYRNFFGECQHPEHPRNKKLEDYVADEL